MTGRCWNQWHSMHLWLGGSFLLMMLYECYWIRYFRSLKTMKDFYSSLLGIPVAGASLPVCAFFLLSIYGKNPFLAAAAVVLGIGHIGIHLNHTDFNPRFPGKKESHESMQEKQG